MAIDRASLLAVLFTFAAAHGALQELQRDPEGRDVSLEIGQLWQKQLRCVSRPRPRSPHVTVCTLALGPNELSL